MKKCKFTEYKRINNKTETIEQDGTFIQFGCNYDDFGDAVGNFSTAIILTADGTLKNIPVENVRFIDSEQSTKLFNFIRTILDDLNTVINDYDDIDSIKRVHNYWISKIIQKIDDIA
ncbi:MAG: hypothetical protein ACOC22_03445 [bacterium]